MMSDENTHHIEEDILNELQLCYFQIEAIISRENIPFLGELEQLRIHLLNVIKNTDILLNQPPDEAKADGNQNPTFNENFKSIEQETLINSTLEDPNVKGLKNIAGLWDVKKILKTLVILPRSQPQLFFNRKAFNSILLFGPPGTGKTQLAHALAYEAKAKLHCVTMGDILTPYVGQSEKNVQFLFKHLMDNTEFSILFIDELDGLCKRRSDSEQEHSRRIKTELMCQMSKMEGNINMFLICATNCPWDLDSAFLRRFQKRIYIALPNAGERFELFNLFMQNIPLQMDMPDWTDLIDKTEGYSGSDLSQVVHDALNIPIIELEDNKIWRLCSDGFYEPVNSTFNFDFEEIVCRDLCDLPPSSVRARNVDKLDLYKALDCVKKTISKDDIKKYVAYEAN